MTMKRMITQLMIGTAALSVSALALADFNDSYGTAPMAAPTASYDNTVFLIGVQAGYANTHWDNLFNQFRPTFSVDTTGFAARGYIGYSFNTYFGAELGYVYLPDSKVKGDNVDARVESYAIDLFGKLVYPVVDGFGLYAKAGGAYLHSSASETALVGTTLADNSHVGPAFGVGAYYQLLPQLTADLSWTRYSGDNKLFRGDGSINTSYQPSPDIVMLGLSYKIPTSFS